MTETRHLKNGVIFIQAILSFVLSRKILHNNHVALLINQFYQVSGISLLMA